MKYHLAWSWLMPVIEKISQHKWGQMTIIQLMYTL